MLSNDIAATGLSDIRRRAKYRRVAREVRQNWKQAFSLASHISVAACVNGSRYWPTSNRLRAGDSASAAADENAQYSVTLAWLPRRVPRPRSCIFGILRATGKTDARE
jgi:hypothetical protein